MKYIKKYNEELNKDTYYRAADILQQMGHTKRASNIYKHIDDVELKTKRDYWLKNIQRCKHNGVLKLRCNQYKTDPFSGFQGRYKSTLTGALELDYYIAPHIDTYNLRFDKEPDKHTGLRFIHIPILIYILPANEIDQYDNEVAYKNEILKSFTLQIEYKIEDEEVKFMGVQHLDNDTKTTHKHDILAVNRRSGVLLKNTLLSCFDEDQDQMSFWIFPQARIYDLIYRNLISKYELDIDYNLTMERILEDIKSISVNNFYKE